MRWTASNSWVSVLGLWLAGCAGTQPGARVGDEPTIAILGKRGISCAAVAITPRLAVTAEHCAPKDEIWYATVPLGITGGEARPGRVILRDDDSDLAVFEAEGLVPAELGDEASFTPATTLVTHVPEPWGIAAVRPAAAKNGFLYSERLKVGCSGSGLWDPEWRLVGLAIGNDNNYGYFVGVGRIAALLQKLPKDLPSQASPLSAREDSALRARLKARAVPVTNVDPEAALTESKRRRERIEKKLAELPPVP